MKAKDKTATNPFLAFGEAQKISGYLTFFCIFLAVVGMVLFPPSNPVLKIHFLLAIITVVVFSVIYFSTSLKENERLAMLPDFIFITANALIYIVLGKYGPFYLVYFFLNIIIDAYFFKLRDYILVTSLSVVAVIGGGLYVWHSDPVMPFAVTIPAISMITVSVLSRKLSSYSLRNREQKQELEKLNRQFLKEKNEVLGLLDSIGDGIVSADDRGRIYLHNKNAAVLLAHKDLDGKALNEIFKLYNRDHVAVNLFDDLGQIKSEVIRTDLLYKKGSQWLRLYLHINPVNLENRFSGLIVLFRDITKEKEVEEKNTEFVAVASHELRTPLAQIEGYLYLAQRQVEGLDIDATVKDNIARSHDAAVNLINLTNDILTVFKIDVGKVEVALKQVKVSDIVDETIKALKPRADEKGLSLAFESHVKKEHAIITDQGKVGQILINLVQNAVKFTDKGRILVALKENDDSLVLEVKDNGIGIEPSAQKRIFDKFYRPENWETRKTQGTGLGLYIVKSLAERIGGKISVESEKGSGSTFKLEIPKEYKDADDLRRASEEELKNFVGSF